MNDILENEKLKIEISKIGGELRSFYGKKRNQEYLWSGSEELWKDRAPNLFPYIARLTDGAYQYQGKEYHLPIHGFVKSNELTVTKTEDELVFELISNEDIRKSYPFTFIYRIRYRLQGTVLSITYEVENTCGKKMYFGIGGHPGFKVPFQNGTSFEDYYIEFEPDIKPVRIQFSEDCFVTGEEPYEGMEGSKIRLRHALFDQDAIVLKDMGKKAILRTKEGTSIALTFPEMDYLGIWHTPRTNAPFVCIEPWSSLPSRKGIVEDLEKQENLICLPADKKYKNTWTISITEL